MALGGIASAPSPSQTATSGNSVNFDNSGWSVNVGAGSANSTKTALPTANQVAGAVASSAGSLLANPIFIIAVGVGLFLFLKHK